MNLFEERIKARAEKRFKNLYDNTVKCILSNELLSKLEIGGYQLIGHHGYNPSKTLFCGDNRLIREVTNIEDIKLRLVKQFEEEERQKIFDNLDILISYLENKEE